jgi:hypothetical protein
VILSYFTLANYFLLLFSLSTTGGDRKDFTLANYFLLLFSLSTTGGDRKDFTLADYFFLGDRFTRHGHLLGELELWFRLNQLLEGPYKELLEDGHVPVLKSFYDRVAAMKGPQAWINNKTKFGDCAHFWLACPEE